jgi:hypothetical protein
LYSGRGGRAAKICSPFVDKPGNAILSQHSWRGIVRCATWTGAMPMADPVTLEIFTDYV